MLRPVRDLDTLLLHAVEAGASDIHLKLGQHPVIRCDGALRRLEDWPKLTESTLDALLRTITASAPAKLAAFHASGELDAAYGAHGLPRFRVNAFRQRGSVSFALRVIPLQVPTFEQLHLPRGVTRLAEEQHGLVLVTGASGAGKSTTLASIIDQINRTRSQHVITIEDPIEIEHEDRGCIVEQREVGVDTASYKDALRAVLRQDPDVILIGELRDPESAEVALQAAESGHLVLSTMHTIDAVETVSRLVEFFPGPKQAAVRQIVSGVLRGVISQRLLPRIGGGRVAAVEVMVTTARIADLIREPTRTDEIRKALEDGGFHDMQSFSQHLVELVLAELVDLPTARSAATNRHDFDLAVDQALRRKRSADGGGAVVVDFDDVLREYPRAG
ncbi:MAG: PilT/PilU family type 4a pilus ATPase [Chloroflexota bacterium]|nr:PilT/PilU family type 4a pilus ATPase [Chloroflexota bacterium]